MNEPNYKDGSTLNLLSSIGRVYNFKSLYAPLKNLDIKSLKQSTNIVLMIIDGMGYEFLKKYGKDSIFNKNLKGKMTTVFPSSTSAAMTSFYTGISPQEHGMTGWHMFMKELGDVIIPLPYVTRFNKNDIMEKTEIDKLFTLPSFVSKLQTKSFFVLGDNIAHSNFTKAVAGKTQRIDYKDMQDYFKQIRKIIKSNKKKKFIFAYYDKHDACCHDSGIENKKTQKHFKDLNKSMINFLKSIEDTNTTLIITADHGHIEVDKSKRIHVEDHPILEECLALPLCGEYRFAYAYVKPSKEKQFVDYMKNKLNYCCKIYKSETLLEKGFFGKGKVHKNFLNRIGDYTILMKEGYGIYNFPIYLKPYYNIGDHGGLSNNELYVPLILIKAD